MIRVHTQRNVRKYVVRLAFFSQPGAAAPRNRVQVSSIWNQKLRTRSRRLRTIGNRLPRLEPVKRTRHV